MAIADHVVDRSLDFLGDFGEDGGSGLSGDVGGSGDDSLLETIAEIVAEAFGRHTYSDRAVVGNKVAGEILGAIEDERERLIGEFHHGESRVGKLADVDLRPERGIDEDEHTLGFGSLLDGVDLGDGIGVCGVAA